MDTIRTLSNPTIIRAGQNRSGQDIVLTPPASRTEHTQDKVTLSFRDLAAQQEQRALSQLTYADILHNKPQQPVFSDPSLKSTQTSSLESPSDEQITVKSTKSQLAVEPIGNRVFEQASNPAIRTFNQVAKTDSTFNFVDTFA